MDVSVDRMHPDTCRRPLFKAASNRCASVGTALMNIMYLVPTNAAEQRSNK